MIFSFMAQVGVPHVPTRWIVRCFQAPGFTALMQVAKTRRVKFIDLLIISQEWTHFKPTNLYHLFSCIVIQFMYKHTTQEFIFRYDFQPFGCRWTTHLLENVAHYVHKEDAGFNCLKPTISCSFKPTIFVITVYHILLMNLSTRIWCVHYFFCPHKYCLVAQILLYSRERSFLTQVRDFS